MGATAAVVITTSVTAAPGIEVANAASVISNNLDTFTDDNTTSTPATPVETPLPGQPADPTPQPATPGETPLPGQPADPVETPLPGQPADPTPQPALTQPVPSAKALPRTGADIFRLAQSGIIAVLFGSALLITSRRRRPRRL